MGWVGPASKQGLTMAAKYGPVAVQAWKVAGPRVKEYSAARAEEFAQRGKAFADAETRVDGSVLRVTRQGRPVFVVLTGEEPVAAYPAGRGAARVAPRPRRPLSPAPRFVRGCEPISRGVTADESGSQASLTTDQRWPSGSAKVPL